MDGPGQASIRDPTEPAQMNVSLRENALFKLSYWTRCEREDLIVA